MGRALQMGNPGFMFRSIWLPNNTRGGPQVLSLEWSLKTVGYVTQIKMKKVVIRIKKTDIRYKY